MRHSLGGGIPIDGEYQLKRTATTGQAFQPDTPAMYLGECACNRQAHACIAQTLYQGVVGAVQAAENAILFFFRNAAAQIAHLQINDIRFGSASAGAIWQFITTLKVR